MASSCILTRSKLHTCSGWLHPLRAPYLSLSCILRRRHTHQLEQPPFFLAWTPPYGHSDGISSRSSYFRRLSSSQAPSSSTIFSANTRNSGLHQSHFRPPRSPNRKTSAGPRQKCLRLRKMVCATLRMRCEAWLVNPFLPDNCLGKDQTWPVLGVVVDMMPCTGEETVNVLVHW